MGLRQRIGSSFETIQDLELAAEQKYMEGVELLLAGRTGAGVYLMGYAAEMWLKNACFLFDGALPGDPVLPLLQPVGKWRQRYHPQVDFEHFHSLWCWCLVLRSKRQRSGLPLSKKLDNKLVRRCRDIHHLWVVKMRYFPDQTTALEAHAVYDHVTWLQKHYRILWRK